MDNSSDRNRVIQDELQEIKNKLNSLIKESTILTCNTELVQVRIRLTKHKQIVASIQFPANYPHDVLLVEFKSKTISEKILDTLLNLCNSEFKKHKGQKQILYLLHFVHQFIVNNPLCICADEVRHLKNNIVDAQRGDWIKIKQKSSTILLRFQQQRYYIETKLAIPHHYPVACATAEITSTNFPELLKKTLSGFCEEIARKCVEKPLKPNPKDPPFIPQPSLQPVTDYIVNFCRKHAIAKCPICKKLALPENPSQIVTDIEHDSYVERVYCDHLFHYGCLDKHMKKPPFTGGKKCPACSKRIYHDRWKISARTAEDRWAHEQARKRELDEVIDFLS
ncbi:uncharacterized protein TRIADDRAFT_23956 [Trichoplax adhaerens]|uniref:RING-type domain-containing protein n=1 Tax=Trichoplax adhaerens TaxID=10228 RepID=B3RVZ9_TRIAD|nr:hypothetical protein TRIADDRAFT_23956 [Trichoplax adhaerens]EDV25583.1 hypothetical protein TRIADDRAFT_23956 [Trichoplax adhaerens]|eukprot:XP_002111616.1 hypothetical protein TRIADDRAFT_23956 [Trichoplax adhaerens]